jgi:hypothetical protein
MKLESTVRYLGIEVDDALSISEHVGLYATMALRPYQAAAATRGRFAIAYTRRWPT